MADIMSKIVDMPPPFAAVPDFAVPLLHSPFHQRIIDMPKIDPKQIVEEAQEAGLQAGIKAFEKWGHVDACGGYILSVDGRSAVGKYLIESGTTWGRIKGVGFPDHPSAPKTQSINVNEAIGLAMKAVLERHGVKITEARSYVD